MNDSILNHKVGSDITGESPTVRLRLIEEALAFVQKARRLSGVTRIALIGSLTTAKPDPMDVDLLVTVTDDAELTLLATWGRKLKGRMQSLNLGADIFLSDPNGKYLGRTCSWKDCGPGIRIDCDADHCGLRHYLHNDFSTIRLADSLVVSPPIELWPKFVSRVPIPEDLKQYLAAMLRD